MKVAEEERKAELGKEQGPELTQESALLQPSAHSASDKADTICWFCHADVTNLKNNMCVGCRKVIKHLCSCYGYGIFCFRRATATAGAREQTGGDTEIIASRCRRRSGRRLRPRRLNRKECDII